MPTFSFAMPILPGKTDAWLKAIAEMKGPRKSAYKASRKAAGIKREHVSRQWTPNGDVAVVHMDAKDPASVLPAFRAPKSDFDRWFLDTVIVGVHGLKPSDPTPPTIEVVLDII